MVADFAIGTGHGAIRNMANRAMAVRLGSWVYGSWKGGYEYAWMISVKKC